jgi:hypothetical protein
VPELGTALGELVLRSARAPPTGERRWTALASRRMVAAAHLVANTRPRSATGRRGRPVGRRGAGPRPHRMAWSPLRPGDRPRSGLVRPHFGTTSPGTPPSTGRLPPPIPGVPGDVVPFRRPTPPVPITPPWPEPFPFIRYAQVGARSYRALGKVTISETNHWSRFRTNVGWPDDRPSPAPGGLNRPTAGRARGAPGRPGSRRSGGRDTRRGPTGHPGCARWRPA